MPHVVLGETVAERNFTTFDFSDDVYKLAGGLLPEFAKTIGLDLGDTPDPDRLGKLVGALGPNKKLREADPVQGVTFEEMLQFAGRAWIPQNGGLPKIVTRGLTDYGAPVPAHAAFLASGGVANTQDRIVKILMESAEPEEGRTLHLPIGARTMDAGTEVENPNIVKFRKDHKGQLPTELQYAETFSLPPLGEKGAGYNVDFRPYVDLTDSRKIADRFASEQPQAFAPGSALVVADVITSGARTALQFRRAGRLEHSDFDAADQPQLFFRSDTRPLAARESQLQFATHYQAPQPALRMAAMTARTLLQAQIEQAS